MVAIGAFSFGALCTAWAAANVTSDTARASAIGTVVMFGNCGGLIATWTFLRASLVPLSALAMVD